MSSMVSSDSHFDNLDSIKKIESPILFIHEKNSSTSIRHSEELYKRGSNILNKLIISSEDSDQDFISSVIRPIQRFFRTIKES